MRNSGSAILWRAAGFVVLVVAVVVLALAVPLPSVANVRDIVNDAGAAGAALFVVGYALVTLMPVPKSVISVASGLIWGFTAGVILVYFGALLGATMAFLLGRLLGREAVERFTGSKVGAVDAILRDRGFLSIIGARLIPLIPFTAINYTAGLTAVRTRDYALGTVLGIIPGTIAYVAVGAFGAEPNAGFWIALGVLGLLTLTGVIVSYRMHAKGHGSSDGPESAEPSAEDTNRPQQ